MSKYSEYDVNYISGVMSLRAPQKQSLKVLDDILEDIELKKNQDLNKALNITNTKYPICSDFERDFMSLSFALATGVGKTRLMGAFITYLYTVKGIKNFFVVAPNITIYNKLQRELSDITHPKYIFKGVGCFAAVPPTVIHGDNYKQAGYNIGMSDCTINIFNISKFNQKEEKKDVGDGAQKQLQIKKLSETLGDSYFNYLSSKQDLVVLMDESHHYRAEQGMSAINELKPVLGLELTATPQVEQGTRTVKFKNVVFEYPLSRAIKDGFTKIPYALTRRDIETLKFTDEEIDKVMLFDGVANHETVKAHLEVYAKNNNVASVKPFVLVVCKDTIHAEKTLAYINSNEFENGKYKGKTIIVHSGQSVAEKEKRVNQLLEIENASNPIEIVVHVNILKEGWDVNNLYTIIPLRTAASKTLREQTLGRGLRLPYGKLTEDAVVDRLVITAHDNFADIVREANDPNSILRAGYVIYAEDSEKVKAVTLPSVAQVRIVEAFNDLVASEQCSNEEKEKLALVMQAVNTSVLNNKQSGDTKSDKEIAEEVLKQKDLADLIKENKEFTDIVERFTVSAVKKQREIIKTETMAIPQIKILDSGKSDYYFEKFTLDVSEMKYFPISDKTVMQNLINQTTEEYEARGLIFQATNPLKVLAIELKSKPEIGDDCTQLLFELITTFMNSLKKCYSEEQVQNIVMFNKQAIANKIYEQMKKHFVASQVTLLEEVDRVTNYIYPFHCADNGRPKKTLYEPLDRNEVPKHIFYGFKKALHLEYKFQSASERDFAIVCENNNKTVKRWLRPAKQQFNLFYGTGERYIPDFVVETDEFMYLVEIKGEDRKDDPDVLAKKERAMRFCEVVNIYAEAKKMKYWKHLFILSKAVTISSDFETLAKNYVV